MKFVGALGLVSVGSATVLHHRVTPLDEVSKEVAAERRILILKSLLNLRICRSY